MLQQLVWLAVSLHQNGAAISTEKSRHPLDRSGIIHDDPGQIRAHVVPQDPVDEVLIPVEQHRRAGGLSGLLNRLPLAQQGLEIVDEQLVTDALRLGPDQETRSRRLDQHTECPQPVALRLRADPPGDVDALAVGLQHQIPARQGKVAGEPGPLRSCRLLHHLNEHLLARFQQFGDAGSPLLQAQWPQIGDMDEAVFLTLSDVDESRINSRENIFNSAEINIAYLITALGNNQLIDALIGQHRCDTQLLRDDNLLGHKQTE